MFFNLFIFLLFCIRNVCACCTCTCVQRKEYKASHSIEDAILYSVSTDQTEHREFVFGCLRTQLILYSGNSSSNHINSDNNKETCSHPGGGSSTDEARAISLITNHYPLKLFHRLFGWIPENSITHFSLFKINMKVVISRLAVSEC